jgi:hypothetical protein
MTPTWADAFRPVLEALFSRGAHWLTPATSGRGADLVQTLHEELTAQLAGA